MRLESRGQNKNYINKEVMELEIIKKKIGNIILIFLLICAISYVISSFKVYKGEEVIPNIFGIYGFTISTGSMEPAIKTGDYLISKKVKSDDIKIGDIITFIDENVIVTHRVLDRITEEDGKSSFITKGDANNIEDDKIIVSEDIVSKYIFKIPMLGYVLDYFKYMNLSIKIGILLFVYLIYLSIGKEKINTKQEENYEKSK